MAMTSSVRPCGASVASVSSVPYFPFEVLVLPLEPQETPKSLVMKSTLLLTSVFEAWQLRAAFDLGIHFLYTEALLPRQAVA